MPHMTRALRGATALALTLPLFLAGTALVGATGASAHVSFEVAQAAAGATFKAVLRVPHGCEGQPTTAVAVTVPEGFAAVKPMPKPGWTLDVSTADDAAPDASRGESVTSGVTEIRWSGGNLPDASSDEFAFQGHVAAVEPGTVLPFKVVQTCADGAISWTEVAAPGQDPHDLAHPAPVLTVVDASQVAPAADAAHHGTSHEAAPQPAASTMAVDTAWMRQPPPGASVGGGYMTLTNTGAEPDRLVAVSADFAGRAEVHQMAVTNGMMMMQPIEVGLEIPAGGSVTLAPGGYHIMFMDLARSPAAGDTVDVTLTFEHAGTLTVPLAVAPIGAGAAPAHAHGHGAGGTGAHGGGHGHGAAQ